MLQNARVTTFTVFELLRESQLRGGKIIPPTQISVKYWVLVIIFLVRSFGSTFEILRMFYLCHENKHFLKETKIDLSQIIAYIIKIKAIKIYHDYNNNLAQKETLTKYAKIETSF